MLVLDGKKNQISNLIHDSHVSVGEKRNRISDFIHEDRFMLVLGKKIEFLTLFTRIMLVLGKKIEFLTLFTSIMLVLGKNRTSNFIHDFTPQPSTRMLYERYDIRRMAPLRSIY